MRSLQLILSFIAGCMMVFYSCKDKVTLDDFELEQGYDYFPLVVGKYITYQVDSITFDIESEGRIVDSVRFYLKEEIVDTLIDDEGRTNYQIHRFVKSKESDPWIIKDVWVAIRTDERAEKVEENLRFIKMVFPVVENETWDGNVFVDKSTIISVNGETLEIFKGWSSHILLVGQPDVINNQSFDEVTTINHSDNVNLIEIRQVTEKYARNVGLIYKEMRIMDTQEIDDFKPWEEKAEKGFILIQQVVEFN